MAETILIVDDEEPVRRTFADWLRQGKLGVEVHAVADAEAALNFANENTIDLAILDWNLGTGSDGLQLLEDLSEFHPDVVAILVTGFAHQATPLDALRMGVRDYLDKNQDLNRETFLASVRRQLERIIPAKRQRQFNSSLLAFREAVEKVLPLVQSSSAMTDRVPLPETIQRLLQFLLRTTHAGDGVLLARYQPAEGEQQFRAYGSDGNQLDPLTVPFEQSLAASVASMQDAVMLNLGELSTAAAIDLLPFERGRRHLLAIAIPVTAGALVVLELFDRADGQPFDDSDKRLLAAASELGSELLRQALSERQTRQTLFSAVEAALQASSLLTSPSDAPPPPAVLDRLKEGLTAQGPQPVDAESTLRLAEAIRVLAMKHGPAAVQHCAVMIEHLQKTLDDILAG